jgi:hypothetical protein
MYNTIAAGDGQWGLAGPEAARTPPRFRAQVVALFRSPQNARYLRELFERTAPAGPPRAYMRATLHDALFEFSSGAGRALDIVSSDPVAVRGAARPATDLWAEVRRLNRAFHEDRMAFLREQAHMFEGRAQAPRPGGDDSEPYHVRMFEADSLRPPGLEHLNSPGPLHALLEDQLGEDAAWSRGDHGRTAEQAMAEYWGDGRVESSAVGAHSHVCPRAHVGAAYGGANTWGDAWKENGGTRFMRREKIPFWQRGGREGYDHDVEETLGSGDRELGGQVRRWDMDRVRKPRAVAQEYRRYGARTGHAT